MPLAFFDTNVLVYCVDPRSPAKQAAARELVARHATAADGVLSTQVLIELYSVLTRKHRIAADTVRALLDGYSAWQVVDTDLRLVQSALDTAQAHGLSIFDAMVIEAAQRSGAVTLYTEDLQHGRRFGDLTLVDPFRAAA